VVFLPRQTSPEYRQRNPFYNIFCKGYKFFHNCKPFSGGDRFIFSGLFSAHAIVGDADQQPCPPASLIPVASRKCPVRVMGEAGIVVTAVDSFGRLR
jgi:hypothetical protein